MVPHSARSSWSYLALILVAGCGATEPVDDTIQDEGSRSFLSRLYDGWFVGSYPEGPPSGFTPAEAPLVAGSGGEGSFLSRLHDGWLGGSYPDEPPPAGGERASASAQPPAVVEPAVDVQPPAVVEAIARVEPLRMDPRWVDFRFYEPDGPRSWDEGWDERLFHEPIRLQEPSRPPEPAVDVQPPAVVEAIARVEPLRMDPRWVDFRFYEPDGPRSWDEGWDERLFHEPIRLQEPSRPPEPAVDVQPPAVVEAIARVEPLRMDPRWVDFRFYEPDGPRSWDEGWDERLFHEPIRLQEPSPPPAPAEVPGAPGEPQGPFGPAAMGDGVAAAEPPDPTAHTEPPGNGEPIPSWPVVQPSSADQGGGWGSFFSKLFGGSGSDSEGVGQPPGLSPSLRGGDARPAGGATSEPPRPVRQPEPVNTNFDGDSVVVSGRVLLAEEYQGVPTQADLNGIGARGGHLSNTHLDHQGRFELLAPTGVGVVCVRVVVWNDREAGDGYAFTWGPITVGDEPISNLEIDFREIGPMAPSRPSPVPVRTEPGPLVE